MDCSAVQQQLERHFDGELGLSDARELDAHLEQCAECSKLQSHLEGLRNAIKHHAVSTAPRGLKRRIRQRLYHSTTTHDGSLRLAWLGFGGGAFALLAVVTWGILSLVTFPRGATVIDEVISAHVRSLMVDHIADVVSADQHTVKPWFKGRLDFAPTIPELSRQDFGLQGGRLDYLQNRPVAALVYTRRAHVINVFVWPSEDPDTGLEIIVVRGYNLLQWREKGLQYWVVSDLNAQELSQFVALYRASPPKQTDESPPGE